MPRSPAEQKEFIQKLRALFIVVVPLLGFIAAIVLCWNRYVFASDLLVLGVMYFFTTLGVTIGYHRMLTHNGFKAPEWMRALILICGTMAWEGSPVQWVSTHVKHHAHSDEDDDPHTPLHGFWHAHMGWLFASKNFPTAQEYAPHLLEDATLVWVDRFSALWMALALVIPYLIGGWTGLVWGGFVRIFLTTHVTWSVNSICHTFGRREYETTDESRNHWLVGLLAFGEGWHNNHHAFPSSAFHGMRWWQFDLSGVIIRTWELLGIVSDVQRIPGETLQAQRIRLQASSLSAAALRDQLRLSVAKADGEVQGFFAAIIERAMGDMEKSLLLQLQQQTCARLAAIQGQLAKATHVKKAKLTVYMQEVTALVEQAKRQSRAYLQSVSPHPRQA